MFSTMLFFFGSRKKYGKMFQDRSEQNDSDKFGNWNVEQRA